MDKEIKVKILSVAKAELMKHRSERNSSADGNLVNFLWSQFLQ
jgi:hypothetical protein